MFSVTTGDISKSLTTSPLLSRSVLMSILCRTMSHFPVEGSCGVCIFRRLPMPKGNW
ncbi:UNVERIFIED_CONTAM: hypothetical protein GTU68_012505 [Idotea baltica]|nr:hypothetical protein [Idotea baltica]